MASAVLGMTNRLQRTRTLERAPRPKPGPVTRLLTGAASLVALAVAIVFLLAAVGPQTGLYGTFTVVSGSMEPSIPTGSLVVVLPVDPVAIRVGDVITYTSPDAPYPTLTHRVLSIIQTSQGVAFQTKGDANLTLDPFEVSYARKGGRVVLAVPWLGYLMAAIGTNTAHIGFGVLLALILGAWWLRIVWKAGSASAAASLAAPATVTPVHQNQFSLWRLAALFLAVALFLATRKGATRG